MQTAQLYVKRFFCSPENCSVRGKRSTLLLISFANQKIPRHHAKLKFRRDHFPCDKHEFSDTV